MFLFLQDDLDSKSSSLREQRRQVPLSSNSGALRGYLNCQLFMVSRHRRRLAGFEREVRERMARMDREAAAEGAESNNKVSVKNVLAVLSKMWKSRDKLCDNSLIGLGASVTNGKDCFCNV